MKNAYSRRHFLRGVGGITLGLPLLEGLSIRSAKAQEAHQTPFAIFMRQANGPASKNFGFDVFRQQEDELFWPRVAPNIFDNPLNLLEGFTARLTNKDIGALSANECTVRGRVFEELAEHLDKLLLISGVEYPALPAGTVGDGHGNNVVQALTGTWQSNLQASIGSQLPRERSLDYLLQQTYAREDEHLYLMAGKKSGGHAECISYGPNGQDLTAFSNPFVAYEQVVSGAGEADPGLSDEVRTRIERREQSVNDYLQYQFEELLRNNSLSTDDRKRLEEHRERVRAIELDVTNPGYVCADDPQRRALLEGHSPAGVDTRDAIIDGDLVLETARYHIDVAILAVLCGRNRGVALQIDNGSASATRYPRRDGSWMENYHYVSHRVARHDGVINSDDNAMYWDHHEIDNLMAETYRYLLDGLRQAGIQDDGIAVWFNEMGHGPLHAPFDIPWIVSGSLGGQLNAGHLVQLKQAYKHEFRFGDAQGVPPNHRLMLNTLGAALGLKESDGVTPLRTFGDSGDPNDAQKPAGHIDALLGPTPLGSNG